MRPGAQLFGWLALGLLVSLSGCDVNSSNSENTTITVEVTNAPGTLAVNQSVSLTATVSNDSKNAGVDWTCSPGGQCGSFNPAHTADGGVTVFTAPAAPGQITITATSTANTSAIDTASVSIVAGSNALLNGPYVFLVQGIDTSGAYFAAGTILADGQGNITGGEQDYADVAINSGPDSLTGSYAIGPDGRGSITLNVANSSGANNGVETFSVAMISSRHALIIQFDGTATSSGTLDFQAPGSTDASAVSGPYAFATSGFDISNETPLAFGGIARLVAPSGAVTGGTIYANDGGNYNSTSLAGTMTAPDSFGRGTITFDAGINFVYYAVRGEVLRLLETGLPSTVSAGTACGQGSAGESLTFSNASLTGSYAFYESGSSSLGALALAGQFTADGKGNFTAGFVDINDAGTNGSGSIAGQGAYQIADDGTGNLNLPATGGTTQNVAKLLIFATDPAINLLDPNATSGGGGALIIDADTAAVGAGVIVPQSGGVFQGNYAMNLQVISSTGQLDIVGQSAADGTGNLAGTVDINNTGTRTGGASLSGESTADTANPGRWTGTLAAGDNSFKIVYYQVSSAMLLVLDINTTDVGNGFLETQQID
jgi:hypothetical protein